MCDILSAPAASCSHFRSPVTSYLSYLGDLFWLCLSWPMWPWALRISSFFWKRFLFWLLRQRTTLPVRFHHLPSLSASLTPWELGVPQASVCLYYLPSNSIQVTGFDSHLLHLRPLDLPDPRVRMNEMVISIWMSLTHHKSIHPKHLIILPFPDLLLLHPLYGRTGTGIHAHTHGRRLEGTHSSSLTYPVRVSFPPPLLSIPTAPALI